MPDPDMKEAFNRARPIDDAKRFRPQIAKVSELLTRLAQSAPDPVEYANRLAARLCPVTLPYELDTPAAFTRASINGRALTDDVMDVILSLATNTDLRDGVAPDTSRMREDFPYYGAPCSRAEQFAVAPIRAAKSA